MCSATGQGDSSSSANPTFTPNIPQAKVGEDVDPQLTWNLLTDIRELFVYPFMVNALRAGTIVAIVAGAVGWVMVLRKQTFAGHTLALIGFPGAAGATLLGIGLGWGYFGACIAGALVIAIRPAPDSSGGSGLNGESAVIGTVQAFALACGFLFVSLYKGFLSGLNNLLFGTISGVSNQQVLLLLIAGVPCLIALAIIGRPLLFASVDPVLARTQHVPVRLLGVLFLVLLAVAAAGTSQVTGSLLVFALLVLPAATANQLTSRPATGVALSVAIAVAVTWLGEGLAYFSIYPIGFWVTSIAFGFYVLVFLGRRLTDWWGHRHVQTKATPVIQ
jgi:zinc/manganese transport system permease protein